MWIPGYPSLSLCGFTHSHLPRPPLMYLRSTGLVRPGVGSDASSHPCWGVVSALGKYSSGHSFLGSWHWGPEEFLPGLGRGWRYRLGLSVKETTCAKA